MTKSDRKELIQDYLNELFINPKSDLIYNKDYELLLSVMLSAQTTDKNVNNTMESIYKEYNSLESLNTLSVSEIEDKIKTIGLFRTKAKNFKRIVEKLIEKGYVPNDREFLESLPGVGRKTTNVVLANLYNEPCIAVDTHVHRVSKRLDIASESDDVLKTEEKLMNFFDKEHFSKLNNQLVLFGRYKCKAKNPECTPCKLKSICKYYNNNLE